MLFELAASPCAGAATGEGGPLLLLGRPQKRLEDESQFPLETARISNLGTLTAADLIAANLSPSLLLLITAL